jgi:hypothetical protein
VAIGTGAVLGTATVLYIGYKWYKKHQILITVPPGLSLNPSVEEANATKETKALRKKLIRKIAAESQEFEENWRAEQESDAAIDNMIESDERCWSIDAREVFDMMGNKINDGTKTQELTPVIAKTMAKSTLKELHLNNDRYGGEWYEDEIKQWNENYDSVEEEKTKYANAAKKELSKNVKNAVEKYISKKIMVVRLRTLRNLAYEWDNKMIRQDLNDRKLKINEITTLNAIMETIEERALKVNMMMTLFNMIGRLAPNELCDV